jgi:procollagen-lysine,2-oxoglutarate 5-dioxygenase
VFDNLPEIPHLVVAIFIEKPTPFLEEFFNRTSEINYPKDKVEML